MNEGVNPPALARRFFGDAARVPAKLAALAENLREEGYLAENLPAGTLALNARGLLVADAVGAEILAALDD